MEKKQVDKHRVIYVNSRKQQREKIFDSRDEAIRFCYDVLEPRRERRTCFGWFCERIEEDKTMEPEQ